MYYKCHDGTVDAGGNSQCTARALKHFLNLTYYYHRLFQRVEIFCFDIVTSIIIHLWATNFPSQCVMAQPHTYIEGAAILGYYGTNLQCRTNFDLKIWWVWWNNGDKNNFEQLQFIGTVDLPKSNLVSKLLGDIWLRVWNVSVTKRSIKNARNSSVNCTWNVVFVHSA